MKAVLISIQPKWCELIANGKKKIEVRKTAPKLQMPFKCYIYKTLGQKKDSFSRNIQNYFNCGKVIGEFICDKIEKFVVGSRACDDVEEKACLSYKEICDYFYGNNYDNTCRIGDAWHISDLKIYDTPKELGEFKSFLSDRDIRCKYISKPYNPYGKQVVHCTLQKCYCEFHNLASQTDCCGYEPLKEIRPLTRPPQSWCYVEELKQEE